MQNLTFTLMKKSLAYGFGLLMVVGLLVGAPLFSPVAAHKDAPTPAPPRQPDNAAAIAALREAIDNGSFELMSSAKQQALLLQARYKFENGVLKEDDYIPPAQGSPRIPEQDPARGLNDDRELATVFANPLVNNPALDLTAQKTQSGTTIVLTGANTAVASFTDSGSFLGGVNSFTGYSTTTDMGTTWTDRGIVPLLGQQNFGDPAPTIINEVEPNGTTGTAQVLSGAENCFIVQGAVTPAGDLDFYRVDNVSVGAKAWFYTDTGGALVAGTGDCVIDVLAADGTTVIEADDDDGTGNGGDGTTESGFASSIAGRTLTGGTYFFRVRGFGAFPGTSVVNPYRMFLVIINTTAVPEVEPNGTAATANTLVTAAQPTGVASGSISSSGEVDFYSVQATAGNILFISMDGDPTRTGVNTLDGVVSLIAPDGTTVLIAADSGFGGANTSEAFDFNISTTGTYFVRVAGFNTESGRAYNLMVSACQGQPCVLTCPTDITVSNDPNRCGAVVTYSNCHTVPCTPPNGSFFSKGTTSVTCTNSGGGGNCAFTVTVNDTQRPSITCPANIATATAQNTCTATSAVVKYPKPTFSDNCPGATVACVPPSGATMPVGTTTVTCTATDTTGNTASCSFTVKVFDVWLQDNSNPAKVLLWNSTTGEYLFCCGTRQFTGTGIKKKQGCVYTLTHNTPTYKVQGLSDKSTFSGNASVQDQSSLPICTINDPDIRNNTSLCSPATTPAGQ